ncbi:MAG: hypothetical protein PVI44_11910 [Balneolaceae bacterium]
MSGCDDAGPVGSDLTKPGAEVTVDTITVNTIDTTHTSTFSGGKNYFSAGAYSDPIFGDISAIGMVEPKLPPSVDSVQSNAKMLMRIIINGDEVYGDSSAIQDFDIYEIDEYWEIAGQKMKDDIKINMNAKVASFSIGEEDSLDVELSSNWFDKYYKFASDTSSDADSLYEHEVYGLALVPQNSKKIIPLDRTSTRFVIQNPDTDTVSVNMSKYAYSLDRTNESFPQGSVPLYSTYESVLQLDVDLSDINAEASTISKTELVLYQNNAALEQSLQSEPLSVQRPPEKNVQLHLADPEDIPKAIDPGSPIASGAYNRTDGAYHLDITSLAQQILLNGFPAGQKNYITLINNGIITPSLLYTNSEQVPVNKKPKIIITYLKNTNK